MQQLASEAAARLQQHGRFEQTGARTKAIAISNRWMAPLCEIAFCDTSVSVAVEGFVVVKDVWHKPAPRAISIVRLIGGIRQAVVSKSGADSGTSNPTQARITRHRSGSVLSWFEVDLHFAAESLQACHDDLIGHRDASPDDSTLPHQWAQFDGSSLSN